MAVRSALFLVLAGAQIASAAIPAAAQTRSTAADRRESAPLATVAGYWTDYFQRVLGTAPAGYAFAVREYGETIEGAHGFQRLPAGNVRGAPMRADVPIHLASISKTITALALLHLLNERSIDLDAPFWPHLRSRFPDFRPGARLDAISFAQLLAHRSGLPSMEINSPMLANLRSQLGRDVPTAPGTAFLYSNLNYTIARALIEAISGESYEAYVRRVVLQPAGVARMTLRPAVDQSFIHRVGDTQSTAFDTDFSETAGGYGWFGTAADVAAIFARFDAGLYLTPASRERMLRERLGLYVIELANGTAYSSDGHWNLQDGRGSKSAVVIFPGGVVVALAMNTVWDGNLVGALTDGYRQNVPTLFPVEPVRTPSPLVRVTIPWHARDVRCTTDGGNPGSSSPRYRHALAFGEGQQLACAGFRRGRRVTHIARLPRS